MGVTALDFNDDLSTALDAVEGSEPEETPEVSAEPAEPVAAAPKAEPVDDAEPVGPVETDEAKAERARDQAGRFAKGAKKTSVRTASSQSVAEGAKTAGVDRAIPAVQPVPAATVEYKGRPLDISKPPQSLGPAAREHWNQVPAPVREAFAKREMDVAQSIGQAVENKTFRDRFHQAVEPHGDFLRNNGMDPFQTVGSLLGDARVIWNGSPQAKAAKIAQMVRAAGVDINLLDQHLAGQAPQGGQQGQPQDHIAAAREAAREEFRQLKAQDDQERTHGGWKAFAAKAEFWADVKHDVADIMELSQRRHGVAMSIEDAYNRAVQLNPEVAGVLKQRNAAETAKQANASTQRSRAAASLVRSQPAAPKDGPKGKKGDWNAAVEAAWDGLEG